MAPRPRPQSTPQGRTLRCAPYRWRGRPAQPTSGCVGWTTSTASAKPKHLRVIYANNLTVETRQYASTVMLHGDLYLPRECSGCVGSFCWLFVSLEWLTH